MPDIGLDHPRAAEGDDIHQVFGGACGQAHEFRPAAAGRRLRDGAQAAAFLHGHHEDGQGGQEQQHELDDVREHHAAKAPEHGIDQHDERPGQHAALIAHAEEGPEKIPHGHHLRGSGEQHEKQDHQRQQPRHGAGIAGLHHGPLGQIAHAADGPCSQAHEQGGHQHGHAVVPEGPHAVGKGQIRRGQGRAPAPP